MASLIVEAQQAAKTARVALLQDFTAGRPSGLHQAFREELTCARFWRRHPTSRGRRLARGVDESPHRPQGDGILGAVERRTRTLPDKAETVKGVRLGKASRPGRLKTTCALVAYSQTITVLSLRRAHRPSRRTPLRLAATPFSNRLRDLTAAFSERSAAGSVLVPCPANDR